MHSVKMKYIKNQQPKLLIKPYLKVKELLEEKLRKKIQNR